MATEPKLLALMSPRNHRSDPNIASEELAVAEFSLSLYGQSKINHLTALFAIEPVKLDLVDNWVVPNVQAMANAIGEYVLINEESIKPLIQVREPVIWRPLEILIHRVEGMTWGCNSTRVRWRHPSIPA